MNRFLINFFGGLASPPRAAALAAAHLQLTPVTVDRPLARKGKILQLRCRDASSQRVKHPIGALVFLVASVLFLPMARGDLVPRPYPSSTPMPTQTSTPDSPTPKKPHRTPNGSAEDASLDLVAPGGVLAGLFVSGATLGLVWIRRRRPNA